MATERQNLKKDIKIHSLFTLAFGTIIGVGWITVMGALLAQAGPMGAIIGFIGGGLVMLVIGMCYAEAATMYPVSGGEVAYVYEMYGTGWCFVAGWFLAFEYIAVTSFEAISVGWVMSALIPGLKGPVVYSALGQDVHLWSLLLGLSVMAAITAINYRGAKVSTLFQDTMTGALVAASLVFIFVGLVWGDPQNLKPFFVADASGSVMFGILAVFVTAPFWFAGFDTIPQAMGEVVEGARFQLIPKIILLAIFLAILFYCLVILATSMSLPRTELLTLELPVADALEAAFNSVWIGKLVLFAGLCGLITTWNAILFAGTRLIFALGRGHMIPPAFAKVHRRYGSPFIAILFVGILGGVGALFGRNAIMLIVNTATACLALVFLLVVLGVAKLRRTRPDHVRPYKVPGGNILPNIAGIFCIGLLIVALYEPFRKAGNAIPAEWIVLLVWALLGGIFWLLAGKMRREVSEERRRWLILNEDD